MQRLAIFSFIVIVVLLLVSTVFDSAGKGDCNKTGGVAGNYTSVKPPVQAANK